MNPIEPIENFRLSKAFAKIAELQRNRYSQITKTDFWVAADSDLERNPVVCDVLFDCFHVAVVEGGFSSKSPNPLMCTLMVMSFSREFTPEDEQLLRFDKLAWALQGMSVHERAVVDRVFEALVGSNVDAFFEAHRPKPQMIQQVAKALAAHEQVDGKYRCERTRQLRPAEIFSQRFWLQCIRERQILDMDGEVDPTPIQEHTLISTHSCFDQAMDELLQNARNGSLRRGTCLQLKFYGFTLLEGYQEAQGLVWHKPGHEQDDIPDYYSADCGFTTQELCQALMEREVVLGHGEQVLQDFLTLDLGL
jgi:hypothetical protein